MAKFATALLAAFFAVLFAGIAVANDTTTAILLPVTAYGKLDIFFYPKSLCALSNHQITD
jgi:hypothetical protein